MIWLWSYLSVGAISLIGLLIMSRLKERLNKESSLLASFRGPLSKREIFIEKVLGPVLAGVFMVIAWPIGIWLVFDEEIKFKGDEKRMKIFEFRVRSSDLLEKTTADAVAASEIVLDPLGAVPALPLGHLHNVWKAFVDERPAGAELWSFSCEWENYWGQQYRREGYAWVGNRKPTSWILTLNERVTVAGEQGSQP